ncbi:helix-turn-helix domain-containing protein [Aeromonas dhakensis]|uniref:helix-turn-helix domain-containing protein n=1 Tax=Aeromonas dhakensis TaxID=196024 RepID=UPI001BFC7694|nr:helix-turn-helix transcriptional regulator [Aeromonas dhakensis]HDT5887841.1 helix-turn-helix transcriptional regulator [Aeromonas dhakensis]HEB4980707.1 helix-turn-helix transcriptional regulator [Aeromonas dhakensis]
MSEATTNRFPGHRIKEERVRLGIKSQSVAATRFGVERETWSRYETGKIEMGREVFQRFVDAGADPDYIVTGIRREVFEASIKKADENPLVTQEERMAGVFAALSPESREQVLATALRLRQLEMMLGVKTCVPGGPPGQTPTEES